MVLDVHKMILSILGCVASGAMLGYAYSSGLLDIIRNVEVRVVDDDEEEEEDDY